MHCILHTHPISARVEARLQCGPHPSHLPPWPLSLIWQLTMLPVVVAAVAAAAANWPPTDAAATISMMRWLWFACWCVCECLRVCLCVHPVFCCCCAFFATIGTTHNRTTTTKVAQQCECECACKQQAENLMCAFPVPPPLPPLRQLQLPP